MNGSLRVLIAKFLRSIREKECSSRGSMYVVEKQDNIYAFEKWIYDKVIHEQRLAGIVVATLQFEFFVVFCLVLIRDIYSLHSVPFIRNEAFF